MENIREQLVRDSVNNMWRPLRFVIEPVDTSTPAPGFPENPNDYTESYIYYLSKLGREDSRCDMDINAFIAPAEDSAQHRTVVDAYMDMLNHLTRAAMVYETYSLRFACDHSPETKAAHRELDQFSIVVPTIIQTIHRITSQVKKDTTLFYSMLKMFYSLNAEIVEIQANDMGSRDFKKNANSAYTIILQIIDLFFLKLGFDHFRIISTQGEDIIRDCDLPASTLEAVSRNQGNYGFLTKFS
ncbi:MAG: hypothetical protein H9W81_08405 [Enterococcus sp.]|nr:hypothetical protein [Enterococcus sp.]